MRTIILLILLVSSCQNEQKISILEKELNILFDAKNNERDEKYKEIAINWCEDNHIKYEKDC